MFFVAATDEDLFWKNNTMREDMKSRYQVCSRTAIQRVFEISRYKAQKEATSGKLPNSKIVEAYRKNLKLSNGSEEISDKYVEISLRILGSACIARRGGGPK